MCATPLPRTARVLARHLMPVDRNLARRGRAQAGQHFGQLGLPVALHAGNAQNLTGVDVEIDIVQQRPARFGDEAQVAHGSHDIAALLRWLVDLQEDGAPHHHPRDLFLADVGRIDAALDLAVAHDRDSIGDLLDFDQLVGNEDDCLALVDQLAHRIEKIVGLLWGEHGSRLVQDQQVGAAIESLEDLHALAHAHWCSVDARRRIHV